MGVGANLKTRFAWHVRQARSASPVVRSPAGKLPSLTPACLASYPIHFAKG